MNLPAEWNEQDLLNLIQLKQEEGLQLEFKSAEGLDSTDKKKTDISKDVSALANSAGGTIVYGISESPQESHFAESLSPVDPTKYSKEWLEQIINSRIQPRIQGVIVHPVELSLSSAGKYAYVVCIPQSSTAHQASDKKYYKRFNFESVAMEDYEVRQTMNRDSRATYQVTSMAAFRKNDNNDFRMFYLNCTLENVSELVGRDVSAVAFVPKHLIALSDSYEVHIEGGLYSRNPGYWSATMNDNKAAMDLHPLSPRQIFFTRELRIPVNLSSHTPLRVVVRVYDQFGLAVTANLLLAIPGLETISIEHVPSPGTSRRSSTSPF